MEKDKDFPGIERFSVQEAIEKVKKEAKEAMINIDLLEYMTDLTLRQKLLLAYFYGTRKGKPTILNFEEDMTLSFKMDKDELLKLENKLLGKKY